MSRDEADDEVTKRPRSRRTRRESVMTLSRSQAPDPSVPGFRDEARRQAALLRGAPEETEALRFIEAAHDPWSTS